MHTSLVWLGFAILASTQPLRAEQSAASPYDLNILAPVQLAGSDAAAADFQTNVLPGMLDTVQAMLPEHQRLSTSALASLFLDPSNLVLSHDASARVYFLGEGAGYHNTLGISTTGGGPLSPDAALIFPGAAYTDGFNGGASTLERSVNALLTPGDFVDLGNFNAGTALDFFLIANGVGTGTFFSTTQSLNQDGMIHAVSLSPSGSAYLIIGFEATKNGGDRDYNDFLFAMNISRPEVQQSMGLSAPEPSLALGALLTGAVFLAGSRRRIR
jgi:hypothetical protein